MEKKIEPNTEIKSNEVALSFSDKENNIGNKKNKLEMIERASQDSNLIITKQGFRFEIVKTLSAKGKNQFHVFLDGQQISKQLASMNKVNEFITYKTNCLIYDKIKAKYIAETGKNPKPTTPRFVDNVLHLDTEDFEVYLELHRKEFQIDA